MRVMLNSFVLDCLQRSIFSNFVRSLNAGTNRERHGRQHKSKDLTFFLLAALVNPSPKPCAVRASFAHFFFHVQRGCEQSSFAFELSCRTPGSHPNLKARTTLYSLINTQQQWHMEAFAQYNNHIWPLSPQPGWLGKGLFLTAAEVSISSSSDCLTSSSFFFFFFFSFFVFFAGVSPSSKRRK